MHPHRPDDETHDLDRLLRLAEWPEPGEAPLARLVRHWQRARRHRRGRVVALATAAALLLAALGIASWQRARPGSGPHLAEQPQSERAGRRPPSALLAPTRATQPGPAAPQPGDQTAEIASVERPARVAAGRAPSLREQVLLLRVLPPARAAGPKAGAMEVAAQGQHEAGPRSGDTRAEVDRAVDALVAAALDHATLDVRALLDELGCRAAIERHLGRAEHRLYELAAPGGKPSQRAAAARLLAALGSPQALPALDRLTGDPVTRAAGMIGICRLASEAELAQRAAGAADPSARRELLAALATRGTTRAIALYLALVERAASRDEALEALDVIGQLSKPPVDALLAHLESPQRSRRLNAALALARLNDAAVVERVCRAVAGIGRQEALIALLLSHSQQAAGCLDEARDNYYLVASVQAAERQLQQLQLPTRGLP